MVQRSVGRYEVRRVIGRGGMATVYLASQTDLERDVALKELNVVEGADPRAARRFLREARLAGSLSHPNIVTVHDYFEFAGKPYIAMEYLARGSLRPHVGRMSLPQVGGVLVGMLAGLAHAERHEVVHRDLKPENVMITGEGSVKIGDFGIAKATRVVQDDIGPNLTVTGTTLGTPNYIAPEQAMAKPLSPATDLYSLGVMAWEMFVGRVPFADTQEPVAVAMRHVNEAIPPVSVVKPDVDRSISDWVERLLIKDPERRVQTADEAGDDLDEILMGLLGPRWRRETPLPPEPGQRVAVLATPTPAPALAGAALGRGAVGGAALGGAALAGATLAPSTRMLPPEPVTQALAPGPRRHTGTIALAVLAVIALIALFSGVLSGPRTPSTSPTGTTTGAPVDQSLSTPPAAAPQPATPTQTAPAQTTPAQSPPAQTDQPPTAAAPQTPAAAPDESGVGDSQSDDPSDDEPEGGSP